MPYEVDNAAIIDLDKRKVLIANYKGKWVLPMGPSPSRGIEGIVDKIKEDLPGIEISPLHLPDQRIVLKGEKRNDNIYIFRLERYPDECGPRFEEFMFVKGREKDHDFSPVLSKVFSKLKSGKYI
jgi:hypothetical protein